MTRFSLFRRATADVLSPLVTAITGQTDLLNRKLDEVVAGLGNQSDLLNRKPDEVVAELRSESDLLGRKSDAVIAGVANQSDLLNRKLDEVVAGLKNQSDLLDRKFDAVIAGVTNQSDLLNRKLEEVVAGLNNQSDLLNRKLDEVSASVGNQSELFNRKFDRLMDCMSGIVAAPDGSGQRRRQGDYQPDDPRILLQLGTFQSRRDGAKIWRSLEQALRIRQGRGSRAAVAALVAELGVRVPLGEESYFAEAFDYYVGMIYAVVGDEQRTIHHLERSNTLPATGDFAIFEDLVRDSLAINRLRGDAAARGIPSFIIASMPRAASATLTHTLGAMLDIPHVRISAGAFSTYVIVPRWLNVVKPGGAVLHDHFGASPCNVDTLRRNDVSEVFVLIRDPRAAAVSLTELDRREHPEIISHTKFSEAVLDIYLSAFIPWLSGWLEVARNPASGLKVHWITSAAVISDIGSVWRLIYGVLAPRYPALVAYQNAVPVLLPRNIVNGGNTESWREFIDEADRRRMWEALPKEVVTLLDLAP